MFNGIHLWICLFVRSFLLTDPFSLLIIIFLSIFSISSLFSLGRFYISRNLSISCSFCSASVISQCWTPRLGNLMWDSDLSLLEENFWSCITQTKQKCSFPVCWSILLYHLIHYWFLMMYFLFIYLFIL